MLSLTINKKLAKEYPWPQQWRERYQAIAHNIPAGSSVLDLGGGLGHLLQFLENPTNYASIDLKPWTDKTIVADFNLGEYPSIGQFDFVVAGGLLEYINDLPTFLINITQYARYLICTYRVANADAPTPMPRNYYSPFDIDEFLRSAGWRVATQELKGSEVLFYCYHA